MTTVQDIPEIKVLEYRMTLGMTTMEGRGFYAPTDVGIADDGRMYVANRSLENVARGVRVTVCDIDYAEKPTHADWALVTAGCGQTWVLGGGVDTCGNTRTLPTIWCFPTI